MNMKGIKYDERFDDEYSNTTTLYFTTPKEYLKKLFPNEEFPEAVGMEISIELPIGKYEAEYATVCVSPMMESGNATECYDWRDIYLPYEEIETILDLAKGGN